MRYLSWPAFHSPRHLQKCNPGMVAFSYTWLRMLSQEPFNLSSQPGSRADIRIVKVTGPLTLQHVFAFQDELRKDPMPFSVIDLSGVDYIDSAGMGAIINFYVSSQKGGRKMVVTGVSERVMALFTLTHVDTLITIKPNIADAEAGF